MRGMRRVVLGLSLVAAALALPIVGADPAAAADPPGNTAARTGVPANIYAIGDSITTSTGTAALGAEHPANSWVTGTNPSSFPDGRDGSPNVNSMRNRLGIPQANAVNLAHNGKRMQDFDDQADQLPSSAQYVVVELGGNDLCRPSVGEMTSVADYRAQFRAGLQAVAAHAPNTLVFVSSIPDIYNLWHLRRGSLKARTFWDNPTGFVIPCESLLQNPGSDSASDENRRRQVRTRTMAFNDVLAEECGAVLRCRFDGYGLFTRTSNRVDPFDNDSPYLPEAQWGFVDQDISHDQGTWGFLCPANFTYSGCGDHFHPSHWGQAKLARAGHENSYQFLTDSTAPTATMAVGRPPDGNGVYAHSVQVTFGGTDANGIRGQEARIQGPTDSAPGPWQQHIGLAPALTVSDTGTTYVQVRSLDNNGNLSASTRQAITVDPSQFDTVGGTVSGPAGPLAGIEVSLHAAGTPGALRTTTTDVNGTYAFTEVLEASAVKVFAHDPTGVHLDEWFDGATTHAGATAVNAPVTADLALALTPGTVSGTVTGPSGGLAGITVELHGSAGEGVVASTTTASGGSYSFSVDPGDYKVRFVDPTGEHLTEWYDEEGTHAAADAVTVTRASTTTVDVDLALTPGVIAGTVSDADGPVEGVRVDLHAADTQGSLGWTMTDVDGHYTFEAVEPGSYKVQFSDASGVHVGEWHDDATDHASADAVVLTRAGTAVDATLAFTPGSVSGTVSGPEGPLEGITVTASPGGASDTTDSSGAYVLDGLDPGPHTISAADVPCAWVGDDGEADVPTGGGTDTVDLTLAAAEPGPHGFTDVPAWVEPAVRWLVDTCNQPPYMEGYADHTFRPAEPITRGAVVRAVWRIAGQPTATTPNTFSDTPAWVDDAVSWAVEQGFMTGYPGNTFRPDADITRAEVARLFFRIAGSPPQTPGGHGLSDVPAWVDSAVTWLVGNGYASGYPDQTFRPTNPITRAEFARMAYRINA